MTAVPANRPPPPFVEPGGWTLGDDELFAEPARREGPPPWVTLLGLLLSVGLIILLVAWEPGDPKEPTDRERAVAFCEETGGYYSNTDGCRWPPAPCVCECDP